LQGETDDSPRIARAVADAPEGQLYIPADRYYLASPIIITNKCSIEMQELTVLEAVKEMDFVLTWDGLSEDVETRTAQSRNCFLKGGTIDAKGFASCLHLTNYWHFTLRDMSLLNGKKYGLRVGHDPGGVEIIANNLYFQCTQGGLAGNIALSTNHTDSHYTDIIVVDYTIGVEDLSGGSNRYTRVHVWVGAVRDYVPNSICYVLKGKTEDEGEILLVDCYADTGTIGFDIYTHVRILGCAYYNNYDWIGLDDVLCIRNNTTKPVLIADSFFTKTSPKATFYKGVPGERVTFRDNIFRGGLTY
jgi:hypothetical protein